MPPRVTVLMTAYNEERLLRGALDSVLGQSFEDFELVVVDDGSTDATADVLASVGDPRVRVLRHERNLGQVPALNRGLAEARGEYVARLDADDRMRPLRLERHVALLDEQPAVAVAGSFMHVRDDEGTTLHEIERRLDDRVDFAFLALRDRLPLFHSCVTFRRDAVGRVGGYDEDLALAEDMDLWRRLLLAGFDARVVPEVLVDYRHHGAQQSWAGAGRQRAHNRTSYERLLAAFAPDAPSELLRLALTDDAGVWSHPDAARLPRALDELAAGVAAKLELGAEDDRRLRKRLGEHVDGLARRGWRAGPRRFWTTAPPLRAWALRQGAAATPWWHALVVAAPILHALLALKRTVARSRTR